MKPSLVLASSSRAASCCSGVSLARSRPMIERQRVPVGQRLGDERAGIDQPVDHARAHAGGLGEARLHPDHPVRGRLDHARPGRRHARRRRPDEADAVARRRRREGAARAHHHAQHHAGRRQRVIGDPVGEVEADARQLRHVVDHLDDGAELLGLDVGRRPRPPAASTPRRDIRQARAGRRRTARARRAFLPARDSRKVPGSASGSMTGTVTGAVSCAGLGLGRGSRQGSLVWLGGS